MNKLTFGTIPQRSTQNHLVIASARDRARLENGPLGKLVFFADSEADAAVLRNVFPLLAVAVSSAGEAEVRKVVDQIRSMRSVPEVPILRLEPDNVDGGAALIRDVLEGSVSRLATLTT